MDTNEPSDGTTTPTPTEETPATPKTRPIITSLVGFGVGTLVFSAIAFAIFGHPGEASLITVATPQTVNIVVTPTPAPPAAVPLNMGVVADGSVAVATANTPACNALLEAGTFASSGKSTSDAETIAHFDAAALLAAEPTLKTSINAISTGIRTNDPSTTALKASTDLCIRLGALTQSGYTAWINSLMALAPQAH